MAEDKEEVVEQTPLTQILAHKVEKTVDVKPGEPAEPTSDSKDQKPDADKPDADKLKDEKAADEKLAAEKLKADDQGKSELADITKELKGLKTALRSERDKRQAAEREEPKPKTSWDEDPDKALEERLSEQTQNAENRFYMLCENLVKAKHDDFDDVVKAFMEGAEDDPVLAGQVYQQMGMEANPAEYLYSFAKNRAEMSDVGGDLSKYKESIEQPLNVKLEELQKQNKELSDQLQSLGKLSPSLNDEPSTAKASIDAESASEPTPMGDIIGPKKRTA